MAAELIPGLSNDLALQCLCCLPEPVLERMKRVNSLWKIALQSDRYFVQRRRRSSTPFIFLVRHTNDGDLLECVYLNWPHVSTQHRVLLSCDLNLGHRLFPQGSICTAFKDSVLVAGGHSCTDVRLFNVLTRKWTPARNMIFSRPNLLFASLGTRLFVFGFDYTYDTDTEDAQAQVYDFTTDRWDAIQSPRSFSTFDLCFACQDKVFVRGRDTLSSTVYSFDPSKNHWEEESDMSSRLHDVWEGSKVVARHDGSLLVATVEKYHQNVLNLKVQRPGGEWIDVTRIPFTGGGDVCIFSQGERTVLLIPSPNMKLEDRTFPFFQGLSVLYVPCSELRLATLCVD